MKQKSIISALAMACALSSAAYAESGYNGEIDAALFYNSGDTSPFGSEFLGYFYSRSSFDFTQQFGAQLDLGGASILGEGGELSFGLHLIYTINDQFAVGAFANREGHLSYLNAPGSDVDHIGVELAYTSDMFSVDAHVGEARYELNSADFTFYGFDLEVPITSVDGLALIGGYHDINKRDEYFYVGVEKQLNNGITLGARYSRDDKENIFGITMNYKFGNGAKFKSRGVSAAMMGDHN